MMAKENGFFEYRRNKRIAKRELAKMMATTLPSLNNFMSKSADVMDYFMRIVDGSKVISTNQVIGYSIEAVAKAFGESESRVSEAIRYILSMDGNQLTRLVSGAAMGSNPDWHVMQKDAPSKEPIEDNEEQNEDNKEQSGDDEE